MIRLWRLVICFGATAALYAGAYALAVRLQRPEMMPAAIGGLSVATCCLGLVLYARRSGFLSPLLAGFLYGTAAACGAAMLIPSFRSVDIVQALVLVLSLAQAVAIFAVDLAITRRIPNAKSLTVAAGFAVVLLIAESFLMLFFYVGWNLRIELMFNIIPVVYGVAAVIFGALAV